VKIDPDVSFLVPTFQRPEYLKRALNSIAIQTILPAKTIIGDNGSGTETKIIVDSFMEKIPNLVYYQHEENIGAFNNWIFLAKQSQTRYSKILWDDDWLENNFLEVVMRILRQSESDGVLCGAYGHIENQTQLWYQDVPDFVSDNWEEIFPYVAYRGIPNSPLAGVQLASDIVSALTEFAYSKKAISENLVVGPDLAINVWCLANNRKLAFTREPLVHMFGDGQNMTNRTSNKVLAPLYRDALLNLHLLNGRSLDSRTADLLDQMVSPKINTKRITKFVKRRTIGMLRKVKSIISRCKWGLS
jgi:glycosyltransferase involved in cell wall biosynthesis